MNRRNFLGWLGATSSAVAIYKHVEIPPSAQHLPAADLTKLADASPAACYVVKNEGEQPMVVHYNRRDPEFESRSKYGAVHVSTLLLPGEELTITAVPAKL